MTIDPVVFGWLLIIDFAMGACLAWIVWDWKFGKALKAMTDACEALKGDSNGS